MLRIEYPNWIELARINVKKGYVYIYIYFFSLYIYIYIFFFFFIHMYIFIRVYDSLALVGRLYRSLARATVVDHTWPKVDTDRIRMNTFRSLVEIVTWAEASIRSSRASLVARAFAMRKQRLWNEEPPARFYGSGPEILREHTCLIIGTHAQRSCEKACLTCWSRGVVAKGPWTSST